MNTTSISKSSRRVSFLIHKDKVKFNVQFKGRENAHHDRGREMLASIIEQLQDVSKVEKTPSMEGGRNMTAVLSPKADPTHGRMITRGRLLRSRCEPACSVSLR